MLKGKPESRKSQNGAEPELTPLYVSSDGRLRLKDTPGFIVGMLSNENYPLPVLIMEHDEN